MNAAEHRSWWQSQTSVPYGLCRCGCGEATTVARYDRPRDGYVRGEPRRFVAGHFAKLNGARMGERSRSLNPSQERDVCDRYRNGERAKVLATSHGISASAVYAILKRHGVQCRPDATRSAFTEAEEIAMCDRYVSGQTGEEIAPDFGCAPATVRGIVRRRGFALRRAGTRRKYDCDDGFFDSIDGERKAYWLGFIAADGCVHGSRLEVKLGRRDRSHLLRLKAGLNSAAPVRDRISRIGDKEYPASVLALTSPQIVAALARQGVVGRKSLVLQWPTSFPNDLMPHFLRGYVDGDGGFYVRKSSRDSSYTPELTFSFIATPNFCKDAQAYLTQAARCSLVKLEPHHNSGMTSLRYSGALQVSRIYNLLYDGATVWLPRKREVIQDHIRVKRINWADTMRSNLGKGYAGRRRRIRSAKLDMTKAQEIRALAAEGVKHSLIAERYGISINTARGVIYGKTWREDL